MVLFFGLVFSIALPPWKLSADAFDSTIQFYLKKIPLHQETFLVVSVFLIRFNCRDIEKMSKIRLLRAF